MYKCGALGDQHWDPHPVPPNMYDIRAGDCFWKASHNTYMGSLQVGVAQESAIRDALNQGYRLIELDFHERDPGVVTISHGPWSTTLPLQATLEDIADRAFRGTDYPLVIACDCTVQTEAARRTLETTIRGTFGNRLLPWMLPEEFHNRILGELLNKVIIVSYELPSIGLGNVTTLKFGTGWVENYNNDHIPATAAVNKAIVRVYPGNVIFSYNPDYGRAIRLGVQWISINVHCKNDNWQEVVNLFADGPIVPKK